MFSYKSRQSLLLLWFDVLLIAWFSNAEIHHVNTTTTHHETVNESLWQKDQSITTKTLSKIDDITQHDSIPPESSIPKIRKTTQTDNKTWQMKLKDDQLLKAINDVAFNNTKQNHTETSILREVGENVYIDVTHKNGTKPILLADVVTQATPTPSAVKKNSTTVNILLKNSNATTTITDKLVTSMPTSQTKNKTDNSTSITTSSSIKKNVTTAAATLATLKTTEVSTAKATITTNYSSTTPTSTTTTTTTTTTSTTTTTTTAKPKKPLITYGMLDYPNLDDSVEQLKIASQPPASADSLPVVEPPNAQPSQEFTSNNYRHKRDYILPLVSLIFIIPMVLTASMVVYRRLRDWWSTRHYRRMDFLIDGMYND